MPLPLTYVGKTHSLQPCPACETKRWNCFRCWSDGDVAFMHFGLREPIPVIDHPRDDYNLRVDECLNCGATLSDGGR